MAMVDIEYNCEAALPEGPSGASSETLGNAAVEGFIEDVRSRVDQFLMRRINNPAAAFVPSDFTMVYAALREIRQQRLAAGNLFCEWGSGCGAVACLASMLDFNAHGLEIDAELVDMSLRLAADYELPTLFVHGSFVPEDWQHIADELADVTWLETHAECGYEELGWEPEDFDVVFAYPWPGEEDVIVDLFEALASNGALLITYHGLNELRIRRKVSKRRWA